MLIDPDVTVLLSRLFQLLITRSEVSRHPPRLDNLSQARSDRGPNWPSTQLIADSSCTKTICNYDTFRQCAASNKLKYKVLTLSDIYDCTVQTNKGMSPTKYALHTADNRQLLS